MSHNLKISSVKCNSVPKHLNENTVKFNYQVSSKAVPKQVKNTYSNSAHKNKRGISDN